MSIIMISLFCFLPVFMVFAVPLLLPSQKASNKSQDATISLLRSIYHRGWYGVLWSVLNLGSFSMYSIPLLMAYCFARLSAPFAPPAIMADGLCFARALNTSFLSSQE